MTSLSSADSAVNVEDGAPGLTVLKELLKEAEEVVEENEGASADGTKWVAITQDNEFSCWTKYRNNRKMLKTIMEVEQPIGVFIDAFFNVQTRGEWDEMYTKCTLLHDYVKEGYHKSNPKVVMDQVAAMTMNIPAPFSWFYKLQPDLPFRFYLEKAEEKGTMLYVCTTWDMEKQERNMTTKIRKYGKMKIVNENKCLLVGCEKVHNWTPDMILRSFIKKKTKGMIQEKLDSYFEYMKKNPDKKQYVACMDD